LRRDPEELMSGAGQGRLGPALAFAAILSALGGCSGTGSTAPSFEPLFKPGGGAAARMRPKNSSVTGTISFIRRGDKVSVTALVQELTPGRHRIFIHEAGNCSSPNLASAGKVWGAADAPPGKRRGDLPEIVAGGEGNASLTVSISGVTVGGGGPTDVIGRSVVVHDGLNPDPQPEFGVVNDWLACGVIEPK
jgi:superoxide dismutase, Cu-Zn family